MEIAATNIPDFTLTKAREIGLAKTINVAEAPDGLGAFTANKDHFDVLFERSDVPGC